MGCGIAKRSELELKLNEFTNSLSIRSVKDTKYSEVVRNAYNNSDRSILKERLLEFLTISKKTPYNDLVPLLQNYIRGLNASDLYLMTFSMLFLTETKPADLLQNFLMLKETFKNEIPFPDNNYKFTKTVLRFYFLFVSKEILQIYKNKKPIEKAELEQIPKFELRYTPPVVDSLIDSYNYRNEQNFTYESFLNHYFDHFAHENVRDEIKTHFKSKPQFGYVPKLKDGKTDVVINQAPVNPNVPKQPVDVAPQNKVVIPQDPHNIKPLPTNLVQSGRPVSPQRFNNPPHLVQQQYSPSKGMYPPNPQYWNYPPNDPNFHPGYYYMPPRNLVSAGARPPSPGRYPNQHPNYNYNYNYNIPPGQVASEVRPYSHTDIPVQNPNYNYANNYQPIYYENPYYNTNDSMNLANHVKNVNFNEPNNGDFQITTTKN